MNLSNVKLPTWKALAHFFEHGDLTPIAVIISVAHYGPVLNDKSDHIIVAFLVGALIDLIHFRTVRRLFQVSGRNRIIGHGVIAVLTTVIAAGYHLRFYENDLLLALPIPIGIGILAQHAAANVHDIAVTRWRNRVKAVLAIAKRLKAAALEFETRIGVLQSQVVSLQADAQGRKEAEAKLKEETKTRLLLESDLNQSERRVKELERIVERHEREIEILKERGRSFSRVNPLAVDVGLMLAGDNITQKEIADKHGVSEATVSRVKTTLNGVGHDGTS